MEPLSPDGLMKRTAQRPTIPGRLAVPALGPLLAAGLLVAACSDGPVNGGPGDPGLVLAAELVVSGIEEPVHLTAPPADPRLFVVGQNGQIRVVKDGELLAEPFLDLSGEVSSGETEQGLLSMAFHPAYASNGWFYVNFTDPVGDTRVVRYSVSSGDPDVADPATGTLILHVEQPYGNHNGGHILFGPGGMLYVAMGDGGSSGDPLGHGQNTGTLHGSLLRLDVDSGDPYAIPSNNPFVGNPDGRDEIWAYGLRNPWRISFDGPGGMLYVADVGQNEWEEVNAVSAFESGLNFGWAIMEGPDCYESDACDTTGLVLPVVSYPIGTQGCAVIGGYVYRGEGIPDLQGHYLYSDWCQGWLRSFRLEGGTAVDETDWDVGELGRILSFGKDAFGELYVLSSGQGGRVYRLVEAEGPEG
jgi:glucose/arabinose dehydrogenase